MLTSFKQIITFLLVILKAHLITSAPSSLLTHFTTNEQTLISAQYIDFTAYDDSVTGFLNDPAFSSLTVIGERLLLGLYKAHVDLLTKYLFDPPDFNEFPLQMWINPLGTNFDDLDTLDTATLQDNENIVGNNDILIAIKMEIVPLICQPVYSLEDKCGTFLEFHRPFDETILAEASVASLESGQTYYTVFLSTKKLCAGKYEVSLATLSLVLIILN